MEWDELVRARKWLRGEDRCVALVCREGEVDREQLLDVLLARLADLDALRNPELDLRRDLSDSVGLLVAEAEAKPCLDEPRVANASMVMSYDRGRVVSRAGRIARDAVRALDRALAIHLGLAAP